MIHPNDMTSWQCGVTVEKEQLHYKMSRLAMFILSYKVVGLDVVLLRDQYNAMEKYHEILVDRIKGFTVENKERA